MNSLNSKIMYEREIRSTLSKLDRVVAFIPEPAQKKKTLDDLAILNDQFKDLIFTEMSTETDQQALQEKNMKKLLTVAKSKFYMLRVNFPKAFEISVDKDYIAENDIFSKEFEDKKKDQPMMK